MDEGTGQACGHPREGLRDVTAAYLVHMGLRLATHKGRNRMLHVLAQEWRLAVERAACKARHPAGKGRPVHLADRMDAAHAARVAQDLARSGRVHPHRS